jgi:hypothetical protein
VKGRIVTTEEFIITLFCEIDDRMGDVRQHRQAKLWPSEVVTIGIMFALKGGILPCLLPMAAARICPLFAVWPERTRLQRLLLRHQVWCDQLLAEPSFFTIIDPYGIELLHLIREQRSSQQIGKKGKSNWRWIVGMKLCLLINDGGEVAPTVSKVGDNSFRCSLMSERVQLLGAAGCE